MSDTKHSPAEDEITLVDIFAVLLKYRWLILGLTFAAALLSILLFVTVPSPNNVTGKPVALEYETVLTAVFAPGLETVADLERVQAVVIQSLMNPELLYDAFYFSSMFMGGINADTAKSAALETISRGIKKTKPVDAANNWSAEIVFGTYKSVVMNGVISIAVRNSDIGKTEKFCEYLLEKANYALNKSLSGTVAAMIEYSGSSVNKAIAINAAKVNQSYLIAQAILDSKFQTLAIMSTYSMSRPASDAVDATAINQAKIKKYGILAVVGFAFLGIFLAFVLNWIEGVKKDPLAMAKFREAMGKKAAKQ